MSASEKVASLVSLWVGTADSAAALTLYMTYTFDADGDCPPCPFGRDFGIDWFDEDFLEASRRDAATRSLRQLLAGNSDGAAIATAFARRWGETLPWEVNTVVLLYDIEYPGTVTFVNSGPVRLRFLGTLPY